MERLQRAAPELYSTMGFPGVGIGSNLGATTTAASPSTTTTTTTTPATDSTTSATPSTPSGKSSLYLARNLKESSPKINLMVLLRDILFLWRKTYYLKIPLGQDCRITNSPFLCNVHITDYMAKLTRKNKQLLKNFFLQLWKFDTKIKVIHHFGKLVQ